MENRELYRIAGGAMANAYAPYSGFHVGAALLTEDGTVYTGVNVENAAYGATICAERTAVAKAVSEGKRSFVKIAIVCTKGTSLPCGTCRQVLAEFAPEIEVIVGDDEDSLRVFRLEELLPYSFTPADLLR